MARKTRHDPWILAALVGVALALALLFLLRAREFRALVPFEGPIAGVAPFASFRGAIERCAPASGRLEVKGWIARPGVARGRHATRVVVRGEDGRLWRMPTELPARYEVHARLQRELGDGIDYYSSGFAASLDLRNAGPALAHGRVFVAYDEGGGRYTLVAVPCVF